MPDLITEHTWVLFGCLGCFSSVIFLPFSANGAPLHGAFLTTVPASASLGISPRSSTLCSHWPPFSPANTSCPFPSWGLLACSSPGSLSGPIRNASSSGRSQFLLFSISPPTFPSYFLSSAQKYLSPWGKSLFCSQLHPQNLAKSLVHNCHPINNCQIHECQFKSCEGILTVALSSTKHSEGFSGKQPFR